MRKWVLPQMEEDLKIAERRAYTYKDLLDLFDTSVKRFPTRVAMRIERGGKKEQYTYEDVRELTLRAAGFLSKGNQTKRPRDFVFHNMPEWGFA
jgi:long-chain acyl-CoA synthetase